MTGYGIHGTGESTRARQSLLAPLVSVLAIVQVLNLSGCAIKKDNFKIEEHVVMVNGAGDLIDPHANVGDPDSNQHILFKPYPTLQTPEKYFGDLFSAIEKNTPPGPGGKKRILLYVHGGMNTARSSIERATKYSQEILAGGTYPIFINWDSSLTSSYLDHLLSLRQGRVAEDWCCGAWKELGGWRHTGAQMAGFAAKVVTTPPYLALDLVRGAIRLPVDIYGVYAEMVSTHWRRTRTQEAEQPYAWPNMDCTTVYEDRKVGITPRADQLLCESSKHTPDSYPIVQGFDERSGFEVAKQVGLTMLTFPVHIASGLVIDAAGTGSWSAMHRRTTAMFSRDDDLWARGPHQKSTGGITLFMTEFREWLKRHGGKERWDVVLVGHSMGTIIVNEMVRQFGEPLEPDHHHDRPLFDKIVYLAAACSLRDYLNTIPHYLEEYEGPTMYHLVLQDNAEAAEQFLWSSLPGSLLVWLDGFFARPDAPLDLVAGRYQNLLRVVHLHDKPHIRSRVSLKAFNFGETAKETNPQTHGDFDNFPFWKETFWQTGENPFAEKRLPSAVRK
jgi:pimeloyl-ACP methyl ester carboxylesterase